MTVDDHDAQILDGSRLHVTDDDQKLQSRAGHRNLGLEDDMIELMVMTKERGYGREHNKILEDEGFHSPAMLMRRCSWSLILLLG